MKKSSIKKILIVKTSSLGDILQSFGVVEVIQKRFPKAQIDWVVEKSFFPLIKAHPKIRAICFSKDSMKEWFLSLKKVREKFYDVVFDLQGNSKSGVIVLASKAKDKVGYNFSSVSEWPNLLFTTKKFAIDKKKNMRDQYFELLEKYFELLDKCLVKEEKKEVERKGKRRKNKKEGQGAGYKATGSFFKFTVPLEGKKKIDKIIEGVKKEEADEGSEKCVEGCSKRKSPKILICFSSRWENKKLPVAMWKEFLLKIEKTMGANFFFVSSNESEEKEALLLQKEVKRGALINDLSLPEWQYLMKKMDLVIGVDSAGVHLAGVLGVRSFSIFGPTAAEIFRPLGKEHGAFQAKCPYQKREDGEKKCSLLRSCKRAGCLQDLNVKNLFSAFSQWCSEQEKWS